jgi:hypothetical protein
MTVRARFLEGPNEAIVIVDVEPHQLADTRAAARFCAEASKALGGAPVLLRCQLGDTVAVSGDRHLHRYGLDPIIDALPVVNVNLALDIPDAI